MTSSDNLLQSMPHSDFSPKTSIFHRKGDSENVAMSNFPSQTMKWNNQRETDDTTMSNTLAQTTEEPQFIIEPSFSLADDHEVSHDLQTKDVSKTVSNDGSKLASVIDSTSSVSSEQLETQTMNASFAAVQSSKVPQPSLEPQIYGGSVFSLMDEHAEDTDRNATQPATRSSVNQNVTDQVCEVQPSAVDQENQTVDSQVVQNLHATDTCPVEYLSATSTSDNQPTVFSDTSKVIKEHISSQSSLSNISTSSTDLLSKPTNHQADLASPEQCSEGYSISTTTHSEISPSGSAVSIQSCSVNLEESSGTLGSSHDQPNTDQIIVKSEIEEILPICDDNKSVSHQDQMIQSHATPEVGEVVDLDTEDVDDCLLVKIDLSKHFVPFGLQIDNTEIVIHNSDSDDESVIEHASAVKEQDLSSKTVSSSDSVSLSSKDVGDKCKSPERDVCSTVVISEIDSCELIGSLSMEVDEINSDTDTPYMEVDEINSDTDTPSRHPMNQSPGPYDCTAEDTIMASTVGHQSVTISSISFVSNTVGSNDVTDKLNSERNNFTVVVPQKSISLDSSLTDYELLELHVDDETPHSESKENKKLKVIFPSKFLQDNLPNPVSKFDTTYSSNAHESVTDISSSDSTMKTRLAPQNQRFKNILKQNNPPKSPNKQLLGQKSIKRITRQSKQSSAKSSKVESNQNISSGQTSAVRTEMASKSSSFMCKICHMSFSARKELVTHTWKCERRFSNRLQLKKREAVCDYSEKPKSANENFGGRNDQNKRNIRVANMSPQAATVQFPSQSQNEQTAAVNFHEQILTSQNKRKCKVVGPAFKGNFKTKKNIKLRVSKNCKKEVKQTLQDAKSLNVIKKQERTIKQQNRQEKVSQAEDQTEIVNEEKIIQCVICEARFSSQWELFKHSINKKKCSASKSKAATKNIPGSKTLLISLNQVSVICKVCHLPFSDDFKLAEHLQLNPSCHHSEKAHTDIELSSANNGMVKKYVKKNRSCKIATGISSSTPVIPKLCTSEGDISMQKQPLEELNCKDKQSKNVADLTNSGIQNLNCTNEECLPLTLQQAGLATEVGKDREFNNSHALFKSNSTGLDNSNTMQVYMDNDGSRDEAEDKLSDLSDLDCESDIEEDSSASEESNVEYRCKLCSKTFHIRSQLVRHTKLHHPSSKRRSVHCKVCTRKFHDLTDLQAHLLQFQYCFIPLTRKLWESKQDPHLCKMCRRSLQSPKDLRKHCFKNMPCRLRYVNLVINNIKTKDSSKSLGLFLSESSEAEVPSVKTPKMILKNNEDNSGVSSSVQDCDIPQNVNLPPNVGFNSAISTPETLATSKKECLNCGKVFTDFLEHIFTHQACLNFYGIYKNRCPVSLPFCFQCKQRFDNITMLTKHACKGFVPYTNTCTVCEFKFTSMMDLNAHMKICRKVPVLRSQAKNCLNEKKTVTANPNSTRQHSQHVSVPVASTSKTIHSTEELFPCKICDAKFPLLRLLLEHSYQHEEETPLTCDRCDSVFVHYNQFVSHQTFHIRMDKENGILSAKTQYNEMPPVLEKLDSSDTSNNQKGHNMSDHLSACLFCHQEFPNEVSKVDHISNTPACLGIMKYIIENKFFTKEPSDNLFDEVKTADPNCCEFCKHNFSDKLFHYLQSTCIYRLEKAILRFRAVSCPPESVVTKTAANKTSNVGISSTTNNKSPLLKKHTFYCPICKKSFHDQNNLLIHQREQHGQLRDRKLPPESPVMDTVDKSDTLFCFSCSKYLRTNAEIENHKSLPCKTVTVLPINVAVKVDLKQLMCTICNIKFTVKYTLMRHMIHKHCDEHANAMMIAAGQRTSHCSICSKDVLVPEWRSHFKRHRITYLQEIKAIPPKEKVICFVCKRLVAQSCILEHINKHPLPSIFTVNSKGGTNVLKRTSSEDAQTVVKQKKQKMETVLNKTSNIFSAVRCKLCDKILQSYKTFKSHFKKSHVEYHPQNWRIWFSLVDPLEHTQSFVGINGSVSSLESKFENASFNIKSIT